MGDEERYKIGSSTSIQSGVNKKRFLLDMLPYVYHMINPSIREINTQLFNKHERCAFQTAIEVMVMLDIKLTMQHLDSFSNGFDSRDQSSFEPDIGKLVKFGSDSSKDCMRANTKSLIMQNYEGIK